jgi:cyclopropane fatty-acyl-phospholipid synthase-like methyltransferase
MWDKRYQQAEYAYGTDPNDFLAGLPLGAKGGQRLLSLAEGEGRNAVYLAKLGFDVLAVDQSIIGLNKALNLARERQTTIKVEQADLEQYQIAPDTYNGVISIFGHFNPNVRRRIHVQAVDGLKKGGFFVLEAYSKEQLAYNTGGPKSLEMLII